MAEMKERGAITSLKIGWIVSAVMATGAYLYFFFAVFIAAVFTSLNSFSWLYLLLGLLSVCYVPFLAGGAYFFFASDLRKKSIAVIGAFSIVLGFVLPGVFILTARALQKK